MTAAPRPVGWLHVACLVWLGSAVALWLFRTPPATALVVACLLFFPIVFVWYLARVVLLWQEQQEERAAQVADSRQVLLGWADDHRHPWGDVWAVRPPVDREAWLLYAPGSPRPDHPWPYEGVTPTAAYAAPGAFTSGRDVRLNDVRRWMGPWIEEVTGRRVVALVDDFTTYGPQGGRHCEYVIYARTGEKVTEEATS